MSMKHVPPFVPNFPLPYLIAALQDHSAAYDAACDRRKAAAAAGDARALDEATFDMNSAANNIMDYIDDTLLYLATIETPEVQA